MGQGPDKPLFVHVAKTGGSSVVWGFGRWIHKGGHNPARILEPRPGWSFGFVRNPWDHAASWFFYSARRHVKPSFRELSAAEIVADFRAWLMPDAAGDVLLRRPDRRFESMLCDAAGDLAVKTVYRFEEFESAWSDIARRIGIDAPALVHRNRNKRRPDVQVADLYDAASLRRVAIIQEWVVDTFGYEFPEGTTC